MKINQILNIKAMKILFRTLLACAVAFSLAACDNKVSADDSSSNSSTNQGGSTSDRVVMKIMSFNIRTGTSDRNTANAWDIRRVGVFEMLKTEEPMIVGLQEARKFQRTEILAACPDYDGFGVCRDTGKDVEGETGSVIYNKKLCTVEKYGYFWLTEKDTSVPNVGWDATYKRMATWAVVKVNKNGKRFFFMSTHLDHEGPMAQAGGMQVIMQKFEELNTEKLPQVLVGDFNVLQTSDVFKVCESTMYNARLKAPSSDNVGTFNNWGSSKKIIDHIFMSNTGFKLRSYSTVNRAFAGITYISDHYPIFVLATLN